VVQVELLLVPECPHADSARAVLVEAMRQLGTSVTVHERVGAFPSPTVLVDGIDVVTGRPFASGRAACRLDRPDVSDVVNALRGATGGAE